MQPTIDPNARREARSHADDLRAAAWLAVEATVAVTEVVEAMHRTIASGPPILGAPLARPAGLLTGLAYGHVRGVTRLVGFGVDRALAALGPLLGESEPGPERDAVVSALNGVLGDHLHATGSPLATEMALCSGGRRLPYDGDALREALPGAGASLLVMVHGSSMSDRRWRHRGHDHGAGLARELGHTPVYARYNSGLHVSTNGRELARHLDALVRAWPTEVAEVNLLGHSMGGLVARSACHAAEEERLPWRSKLRRLACLGTPHHGAPLERGGSWAHALLGVSAYSAPIGRLARLRSAGVTDLRHGYVLDAHWEGRDRFAPARDPRRDLSLPEGVACFAVAGTTTTTPSARLPGDGLVPVDSALGRHARADLALAFPPSHQRVAFGTGHLDLLGSPDVYAQLREWFAPAAL